MPQCVSPYTSLAETPQVQQCSHRSGQQHAQQQRQALLAGGRCSPPSAHSARRRQHTRGASQHTRRDPRVSDAATGCPLAAAPRRSRV